MSAGTPIPPPQPTGKKHPVLYSAPFFVALIGIAIGAVCWYATTPAFEGIVRGRLVTTLEKATGGRVELGSFHWRLFHLEFEADNLTIHGLEAANEIPYAHIDRLFVRAKIISFFQAKAGLNVLEGNSPVVHLIVYPDGTTNQPHPKTQSKGGNVTDTLFDLAVDRTEITHGLLLLNERAIPFDLSASDLGVTVTYDAVRDHYLAAIQAADITAQRGKRSAVHSLLNVKADLSRKDAVLSEFKLQTGESRKQGSVLQATGSLTNYSDPQFALSVKGTVDVREVEALSDVPGLERGIAEIQLQGKGNSSGFAIDGQTKVTGAAYAAYNVRAAGVNASTNIHITQQELTLTAMKARLAEGGSIEGELHLLNWLAPSPTASALRDAIAKAKSGKSSPNTTIPQGIIRAQVSGVSLRSVLAITTPAGFRDLGFDTFASGATTVDWLGNPDDLTVSARMTMAAGSGAVDVPLSGSLDATYYNRRGAVDVRTLIAQTPGSHIQVQGSLGVYPLEERESLVQADLTTTNLGEFDKTLMALGLSTTDAEGTKTGVRAIPIHLQGEAEFHGTVTKSLLQPDVKGHLTARNFDTVFASAAPTTTPSTATNPGSSAASPAASAPAAALPASFKAPSSMHWDSLDAQAEYSTEMISVTQSTLLRGKTAIHVNGQLHAHQISRRRSAYDDQSAISATVGVQDAAIPDLLVIAGSSAPVSGTLSLQAQVGGKVGNLNGGGHMSVLGGEIYGEAYHSLNPDLKFAGQELDATNLKFLQDGGQITGDGGYDIRAKTVHFEAKGSGFDLAHFRQLQNSKVPVAGVLNFEANGSGPVETPVVQGNLHLVNLVVDNQFKGSLDADAHLDHKTLIYKVTSALDAARLQAAGQTLLSGDYPTKVNVTATELHIERFLQLFKVSDVTSSSVLTLRAAISGPARLPKQMEGTIDINKFAVSVGGVPLQSDGPLHAALKNGLVHLDPVGITGDDTNLHAQGSVGIFEAPRILDLHANGSVNLKLAQSFDPNIVALGHLDFSIDAGGTMQKPNLGGQVKFTNASMSLQDLPNGLSQMNGTLVFDQDRLTVQKLTAVTGGGRLEIGGFITYQQGIYGDLTATGKDIRIRYPQGVSSMADAKLRLQGTETNLLLSGNVLVTRFSISPNLDLASLKSTASSAGPLPDANAPSNHVQLEVHVTSAPELNFQNSFAKLAGDVDLRVRGTLANPALLGHITVTDGSAVFAGTNYQLQRGEIYFSNPIHIDPVIDLDATARVEDYDIDVGLHGTLSKLNLTYRSEPPLPEADVFALLALGRTQEEQQIYSQQQSAAGVNSTADALLGGALNATVSSRVQKLFGVGSVKIDPTFVGNLGNSTARITVEEKIGKRATLTYATNVNSTAQQLIQGQLYLTPNVSVVAQRDESGVFSLILKIHQRRR